MAKENRPGPAPRAVLGRRRFVGLALAAPSAVLASASRAEHVYDSELVKAGVIAQLTRFVEWPPSAHGPHPDVLEIAVLGSSRVAEALRARDRTGLRVRVVQRAEDVGEVHVVFVTRAADAALPGVVRDLGGRPVLVIGEGPSAAARGAAFGLRDDGDRVRLEVNRGALSRAQLRVSYHVLRLSTEVSP